MPHSAPGPGRWDITVTKGAAWSTSATWYTNRATSTPKVITGGTFTVVVKTAADSSGTSAGTATAAVVSGPAGTFSVAQTEAQVNAMTAGRYFWSGSFTASGGGDPLPVWAGTFVVEDVLDA